MWKFTKSTSNPSENLVAPMFPGVYEDMRGNLWDVKWKSTGVLVGGVWVAYPQKATAAAYGIQEKRMFSSASDAPALVDGIEERLEIARRDAKSGSWVWLLVLGVVLYADKGRR